MAAQRSESLVRARMRCWFTIAALVCGMVFTGATTQASTITFSNTGAIAIPTQGTATPYPSTISVVGLGGPITEVTATLDGFSHSFPDDLGALLVGPSGQTVVLFNGAGDGTDATDLTLTFDDDAAATLPATSQLLSGTYLPSNIFPADSFSAPAPLAPYGTTLSVFDGFSANGLWSLYVVDFVEGDSGSISRGWSVTITTQDDAAPVPEPASLTLLGLGLVGMAGRSWRQRKAS